MTGRTDGGVSGWDPDGWGPSGWGPSGWGPCGWGPCGWGPCGWDSGGWDSGGWGPDSWDAFARAHEWPGPDPVEMAAEIAVSARRPAPDERLWRGGQHVAAARHIDDAAILSGEL